MEDKLRALRRNMPTDPPKKNTNQRKLSRIWLFKLLPWVLVAAALILLYLLFGQRLIPATNVEVETVVTVPSTSIMGDDNIGAVSSSQTTDPYSGSVLFQASGWFEADPFPHRVTALASGVIESVHVLEGESVEAGEAVATMIREDTDLFVRQALAGLNSTRASVEKAKYDLKLADARIETMARQIVAAEARRKELSDLAKRAENLGSEVIAEEAIIQAKLRMKTQIERVSALRAERVEREIEKDGLLAQLKHQEALFAQAESRYAEAELRQSRMVVRAPVGGIIQRLIATPGQKKILMADNPESATVAWIFQPKEMQARIDVPLAEAAQLVIGQAVLIETEYLPERELQGYVQRIVGEADLQRNTLQAKVRITNPPVGLRPEILCRARFLNTSVQKGNSSDGKGVSIRSDSHESVRVMVSRSALVDMQGLRAIVWAINSEGDRVERRDVILTGNENGDYIEIKKGLRPGDQVVIKPLDNFKNGKRIEF